MKFHLIFWNSSQQERSAFDLDEADTGDYNPSAGSRLVASRRTRNRESNADSAANSETKSQPIFRGTTPATAAQGESLKRSIN